MRLKMNLAITVVFLILGIILAWQYKSIEINNKTASSQIKRAEELMNELIRERKINEGLAKKIEELDKRNREFESASGEITKTTQLLTQELEKARTIAGLTDVKGKGIIITINHNEYSYIDDMNILDVLNELRASDVQAISVNNERIVATSEVRVAGKFIMINGRQMTAPFEIKAIGDPDKLEHSLKMIGGVIETLEAYQLKVEVKRSDSILIPKVRDDGSVLRYDMLTPVKK
ncbi:MAG: DUF881 domain-containing protein [Clostridia bacterium]|nr:DUF881 domain-containing protein [Clostridia bacterium]